jgi:hypothetical protein
LYLLYLTRQVNDGLPRPNPDDAGPIMCRSMGLPITSGCDTAWIRTRDCSDVSCTKMQWLRPLRHSGGQKMFSCCSSKEPWGLMVRMATINPGSLTPGSWLKAVGYQIKYQRF